MLHSAPDAPIRAFIPLPRTLQSWLQSVASPPDDHPVRGLVPCFIPPLQSGASFCRILSVASDAPVHGTGFTPVGRSSPGASAVFPGCSNPGRLFIAFSQLPRTLFHPRSNPSAVLHSAPDAPGRLFVVFSPLPGPWQSGAPGSPPDDPVRGLVPCFIPPRLLQSGASFYRILSVASDPRTIQSGGYCRASSPWHLVHPRTIQSGG